MRRASKCGFSNLDTAYDLTAYLWTLRLMVLFSDGTNFYPELCTKDAELTSFLKLPERDSLQTPAKLLQHLKRKLATAERRQPLLPTDTTLAHNLRELPTAIGCDDTSRDILLFMVIQRQHAGLNAALHRVGPITASGVFKVLSICLGHTPADIARALDDRGKLPRSALVSIDHAYNGPFELKVDMLEGLAELLTMTHTRTLDMFRHSLRPSPPPRLGLDDYPHLTHDLTICQRYLQHAVQGHTAGINILIYGPPGTGKTEMVRALAQSAGLTLYEIPTDDERGKPRPGKQRFDCFRLAQSLLGDTPSNALLFDEVEDVFCEPRLSMNDKGNSSGVKGWINGMLESNPVPTFWITNHLQSMDRAYRRRFDLVLHVDVPPKSVRQHILSEHTRDLDLSPHWRSNAASHAALTPAIIERAVRVSKVVCASGADLPAETVLTQVMNNTLNALGAGRLHVDRSDNFGEYRLDLLNTDCNMVQLLEGLARTGEGRLCLYGPPGTGKTAFGRHIAEALSKPLLVKRASDILSPYVGMAEKHIAAMFREADLDCAVLLLDEADSLLQDRRGAERSWEVTQVNEMLTQMENFHGIFIASTNLMDSLDEAAMRRFDVKVRFDYLSKAQAQEMLERLASKLEIILTAESDERQRIARLSLTPGDFAAVERGARLHRPATPNELVNRLLSVRPQGSGKLSSPIGFLAHEH